MSRNIRYDIYDPPGIIVACMQGRITLEELIKHVDELANDKLFHDGLDKLVDMNRVTKFELHLEDEVQLINHKMTKRVLERRIAFIAAEDSLFGVSRMYQMLSEEVHTDVAVFRIMDEAILWLGLPTEFREQLNKSMAKLAVF